MLKDLNHLDNNAQITKQQYETVSDNKTSSWQKQSSSTHQFIRASKGVKIRINNSKEVKIMTTLLIGKKDGNGTKSSRETCRILRLRRLYHGRLPHGRIGIPGGGILQNLTMSSEWDVLSMRFRIAGTWNRQFDGECTHPQRAWCTIQSVHTHGHWMRACGSRAGNGSVALCHHCSPESVRHQVSHVSSLLVVATSSHFSLTAARSTAWTARPCPRRLCVHPESLPQEPLPKNISKRNPVGKQRYKTTLTPQLWACRKPAPEHAHSLRITLQIADFIRPILIYWHTRPCRSTKSCKFQKQNCSALMSRFFF